MTSNFIAIIAEVVGLGLGRGPARVECLRTHLTSKDFLSTYPQGGYTGARTVGRTRVVELKRHTTRLASTLGSLPLPYEDVSGEAMKALQDESRLSALLVPLLRQGLKTWEKLVPGSEAKLMILGCYDAQKKCPRLLTHISALSIRPSSKPDGQGVQVEMGGRPRSNPKCKDSQWARDRRVLEDTMDPESDEIILPIRGCVERDEITKPTKESSLIKPEKSGFVWKYRGTVVSFGVLVTAVGLYHMFQYGSVSPLGRSMLRTLGLWNNGPLWTGSGWVSRGGSAFVQWIKRYRPSPSS
ncbi:hypothetical protein BJ684DRAFT_22241 [Piptocephalis cylindrospora]|uniref:Uncharacterized protein n=1 Tax=Piptocephalis cylindrospora TaxID=1907219 RepID=A0A4P9XXU4_9FUNG|nr:hypothetical protein BJ684DRAFT_22241 [Piptocephalis cylindrospora]|eukprot:RKP11216.1 hypothetical protein BJ684DRAFT_22241 [Piptocephalis cylindrospora]